MVFKPGRTFVFAPSGLNLRASADANSEKLATVSRGTAVEVLAAPAANDMTVDNLTGGMAKVKVNGQEGYMFSGYLCRAPFPEEEVSTENYVETARGQGFDVYFEETHRDYGGYFQAEFSIVIKGLSMQEAFLLGKSLYRIPKGLNFPNMQGKGSITTKNPQPHAEAWTDELVAEYNAQGKLQSLAYSFRAEATGLVVAVKYSEEHNGYRISQLGIAD